MKRLLAFFLLFPLLADAGHVVFDYRNSALEPQGVKQVHLYPVYVYDTNGVLVTRDRISRPTLSAGTCTISNVLQGTYRAEFQGGYNVTTNWFQFPATNGVINAWLYRTNSAFGWIPTNGIFATLADLTNAINSSGVSSLNSSTGAVSIVGAGYVTVGTTSGVVTVTGTGGGGTTTTNASDLTTGTLSAALLPDGVVTNRYQSELQLVGPGRLAIGSTNPVTLVGSGGVLTVYGITNGGYPSFAVVTADSFFAQDEEYGFLGAGSQLTDLNGANIQAGTINSNKLDVATAAQLALVGGGTGTQLQVGTNVFGILSNYVAGVYSQTTSLIIKGSTNTIANGVYSQVYSNYTAEGDELAEALWTNGNNCGIWHWDDSSGQKLHITNSAGALLFKSEVEGASPTLPVFPSGISLYAVGNGMDGTMGWTSNTIAEPYLELKGWQADTNLYAGDIHGGVIYGDLSGATNYQVTSVGGVQTSNLISTVNINETLRHSFAAPPMGFISGELLGSSEATAIGIARYLYANGLTAAGYNLVCLDANWASRDENGLPILKTNLYPSGLASLLNALATNDCKLGLYVSMWPWYGELKINESTAYRDAYTMASWGIGWLKCDGGQEDAMPGGESAAKHIGELIAAGLDEGAANNGFPPVFLHYNVPTNRMFATRFANGIYAAQPVEDATGVGDSVSSPASMAFQSMYVFVTNAPNTTGRGVWKCPLDVGNGTGYAYWDTNCTRVYVGLRCLEPWTLMLADGQLASTHASHIGIYTNREAIRINQDDAVGGAQWLSTNCVPITNAVSQKARWRRMANGDIAVGLWNWDTNNPSLFTLNLTKLPFLQTNVAYVLNVFDNAGQLVTNSIDQLVNTNGYNLLRISKAATIYNGAVLTNGGVFRNSDNTHFITNGAYGFAVDRAPVQYFPLASTSVYADNSIIANTTLGIGGSSPTSQLRSGGNGIICIGGPGTRYPLARIYFDCENTLRSTNASILHASNTNGVPSLAIVNGVNGAANLFVGGSVAVTNGLLISSNSFINVPTLTAGQNFYCSSNGVPHVIWSDEAGTLHTNRLVE